MKKLYLLGIALLAATFAFAQANQANSSSNYRAENASKFAQAEVSIFNTPAKGNHSATKDALLSEDFSSTTFPPTGWTKIDGTESSGELHWIRGVNKSCGSLGQVPGEYAFVNWEIDPNDGIYTDVANQDEWLITPEVHLPANAALKFDFLTFFSFMNGAADLNVKISTDAGANWTQIWNEYEAYEAFDLATGEWDNIVLDLNTYANQDVKIAFQYIGRDGCWVLVDNVEISQILPKDFELSDARVTFNPQYSNYGCEGFISTFPRSDVGGDSTTYNLFGGVIANYGLEQVIVSMTAKVFNPSNQEVFSFTFDNDTIAGGTWVNGSFIAKRDTIQSYAPVTDSTSRILPGSAWFMEGNEQGIYRYEISIVPVGFTYANEANRALSYTAQTNFTDECVFERGIEASSYVSTSSTYSGFGTPYIVRNPNDVLQYVDAYILDAEEGTTFKYVIYNSELTQVIIETEPYVVGEDFQPGYVRLASEDPVSLEEIGIEEGYYLPVVVTIEVSAGTVYLGLDKNVPGYLTFYGLKSDGWHLYSDDESMMIRLYTCQNVDDAVEAIEANEIEMFPNPTTGIVNFNNVENATIEVFNMMGQLVSRVENASENATMDLSTVANGNYVVRIVKDGEVSTSKLSIAR